MSYTFDLTSGETFANLRERVLFNSFNSARYTEFVKRALNDAITAICRRPGFGEAYEVQAYNSAGVVQRGASKPWLRIDEVWTTNATQVATGELAFMKAASIPLQRFTSHQIGATGVGAGPAGYIVRRSTTPAGFAPALDVTVLPPSAAGGFVAIKGLQRPQAMTADGDTTGLGAELDGAVVAYAKASCFENEDDFDLATQWRLRYDAELRQATEGGDTTDGPDVVDGMWDC